MLAFSDWAYDQVTCAKMAKNYPTCDVTHEKKRNPNPTKFFIAN